MQLYYYPFFPTHFILCHPCHNSFAQNCNRTSTTVAARILTLSLKEHRGNTFLVAAKCSENMVVGEYSLNEDMYFVILIELPKDTSIQLIQYKLQYN